MRRLLDILFPPRVDEIALRNVSVSDFLALAAPRLVPATRPGTVALLPFDHPPVRAAIHEAKYHGNARAFKLLSCTFAAYLRTMGSQPGHIIIVPVPLGKERRRERGFNQAEEVARYALRSLGEDGARMFELEPGLLERTRETVSQVSLQRRAREENMHGAFTASPRLRSASAAELSATTYIIVDDVLTTGATLQAAVDALKEAGAAHVIPLALAH